MSTWPTDFDDWVEDAFFWDDGTVYGKSKDEMKKIFQPAKDMINESLDRYFDRNYDERFSWRDSRDCMWDDVMDAYPEIKETIEGLERMKGGM